TLSFSNDMKEYINHDSSGFYTLISKEKIPMGKYKIKLNMISNDNTNDCVFYVIDCYVDVSENKVELIRI
ncbi:TPA: hypothetical protein ACJTCA_004312, partial [Yersinia enterocolitica]